MAGFQVSTEAHWFLGFPAFRLSHQSATAIWKNRPCRRAGLWVSRGLLERRRSRSTARREGES